jgi:molybdopterin-guanine dinucleotide biosynthesis protein MobB
MDYPIPLVGFAAWSGTGKTTLLKHLIPILRAKGIRIAVVKHAHHTFDVDHPGKDSHTLRHAGAEQVMLASSKRYAWMRELPESQKEPTLADALHYLDTDGIDLVLVEGFKKEAFLKIECHRPATLKPLLYPDDNTIIAIATDQPMKKDPGIPQLSLNDPTEVADFILKKILAWTG